VGTGAGNAEKDSPPQAVEWGGAGKRAGGQRFLGPHPPRNELYQHLLAAILHPVRDHLNPPKKQTLSDLSTTLNPDHYYDGSLKGWSQFRKIGVL